MTLTDLRIEKLVTRSKESAWAAYGEIEHRLRKRREKEMGERSESKASENG